MATSESEDNVSECNEGERETQDDGMGDSCDVEKQQMLLADSLVEQRANWHIGGSTSSPRFGDRGSIGMHDVVSAADSDPRDHGVNRSCASMVFLRGDLSADELSSVP